MDLKISLDLPVLKHQAIKGGGVGQSAGDADEDDGDSTVGSSR